MKMQNPVYLFIVFLLVVGLACSTSAAPEAATTETESTAQKEPTKEPQSTFTPAPTVTPAASPTPTAQQFFTEEFDTTNNNWPYFVVDGTTSTITNQENPKMSVTLENDLLTFDLKDEDLWVYTTYQPFEYDDVRMDASVSNRGANTNNVSLICRYTETGWYEFNIGNDGLYSILVAIVNSDGVVGYDLVYNGGSTAIKSGKATNEYTAVCKGRELSLFINGVEARTITDNQYILTSGKVGVSVSSFFVVPIIVDIEWIKISEP